MLKILVSEILEYYLSSTRSNNILKYIAYFSLFIGFILLIIGNFIHFNTNEDSVFILVASTVSIGISLVSYTVNYYIRQQNKYKILLPLSENYFLIKNILGYALDVIRGKKINSSLPTVIGGCAIGILTLLIYRKLKSSDKFPVRGYFNKLK